MQKKEQALCEAQERERRLKVQCESVSRDLKHEKEEVITRKDRQVQTLYRILIIWIIYKH